MIEATARILTDEGPHALTTNRVAEVAGVSIGSLYQYVPNKDALVALVMEAELARDHAAWAAIMADAPSMTLDALLARAIHDSTERFAQRAAIHRVILPLVSTVERWDVVRVTVADMREGFIALLMSRPDELHDALRDDPASLRAAAFVAFAAIEATFNEAMCRAPELLDGPHLPAHLITLCRALLIKTP